jgi:hypothetical protein
MVKKRVIPMSNGKENLSYEVFICSKAKTEKKLNLG